MVAGRLDHRRADRHSGAVSLLHSRLAHSDRRSCLIPAISFGVLMLGTKFPPTERVAAGVSAGGMAREMLRPFFLVWFCAMFLTAASELAPGQWVDLALSRTVNMPGILLLVYVSGLMFVMRHFAGSVANKLSSVGLLWVSCLLASLGLLALSFANGPVTGLLAATIWGTGVCFMWPTMLAAASERFPKGGALLMGLMGTAGTLSIFFVLPLMGKIYDHYIKAGERWSEVSAKIIADHNCRSASWRFFQRCCCWSSARSGFTRSRAADSRPQRSRRRRNWVSRSSSEL